MMVALLMFFSPHCAEAVDFFLVAEEDELCDTFLKDDVGGFEGSLFSSFGQDDALVGVLGLGADLF